METTAFISPSPTKKNTSTKTTTVVKTVFDVDITSEELLELCGFLMLKEDYLRTTSPDGALGDLWVLFRMRNDFAGAEMFRKRIQDQDFRERITYTDLVPS